MEDSDDRIPYELVCGHLITTLDLVTEENYGGALDAFSKAGEEIDKHDLSVPRRRNLSDKLLEMADRRSKERIEGEMEEGNLRRAKSLLEEYMGVRQHWPGDIPEEYHALEEELEEKI